ncbi:GIY-YIG nuclease family protein [Neobacillus soli]|uniref:GIY-YIG nuclease family protein n=1 Tax=Neobacillus soli TaxID=220688 RepID=UPI000826FE17|nr:GIY-YIG nuclease family protein [Neobacillus soli]
MNFFIFIIYLFFFGWFFSKPQRLFLLFIFFGLFICNPPGYTFISPFIIIGIAGYQFWVIGYKIFLKHRNKKVNVDNKEIRKKGIHRKLQEARQWEQFEKGNSLKIQREQRRIERLQREQQEKESILQAYGLDEEIYNIIQYLNQLLHIQKHHLTKNEREQKAAILNNYNLYIQKLGYGYVYFVKENTKGAIKIGKAKDPYDRIVNGFGVKIPFELEVVYLIKTWNDTKLESAFHDIFKNKRVNGEWFSLNEEDIVWIKSKNYPIEMLNLLSKK